MWCQIVMAIRRLKHRHRHTQTHTHHQVNVTWWANEDIIEPRCSSKCVCVREREYVCVNVGAIYSFLSVYLGRRLASRFVFAFCIVSLSLSLFASFKWCNWLDCHSFQIHAYQHGSMKSINLLDNYHTISCYFERLRPRIYTQIYKCIIYGVWMHV